MNKKVILLLILVLFVTTGCTATYNVEIYNDEIRVDGKVVELDSTKWHDSILGTTYIEMIDWKTTGDDESPVADGIYKISDDNQLGIGSKNKYTFDNYEESPGIKACYKYFNIIEENGNIILSTSVENTCFDSYPNLDFITVNLKTNHKVVSNNADIVDGYHYTWNLSRENKDDASISITLKKNEYIFNYENEFVKKVIYSLVIIGIIIGVGSVIYLFINKKRKNVNEI